MVSIIMSVYNPKKVFLKKSIDSVCYQSFREFEFIIVNDGSSYDITQFLYKYKCRNSHIILIDNSKNIGLTNSLNIALKHVRGIYIARIDADDLWHPQKLEKQIGFLEKNPSVGLVGTMYEEIDEFGNVIGPQRVPFLETDKDIKRNIIKFNPFFHSSVVFRKEILDTIGFYNEKFKYAQDYEYWVRIMTKYKVYNIPEVLAYRRYTSNMISIKKEKLQRYYAFRAKLKAFELLKVPKYQMVYLIKDLLFLSTPLSIINFLRKWKRT